MSNVKEIIEHMPLTISQELVDYVNNIALLGSRYLFLSRKGKIQYGYCTHCRSETRIEKPCKTHEFQICTSCGALVSTRYSGRGRGAMVDEAYVVWYGKSQINSTSLVAQGLHVKRDYSGSYKAVDTVFTVQAMYLFEPGEVHGVGKAKFGNARMLRKDWPTYQYYESKSIISELENSMQRPPFYMCEDNIKTAVTGTLFQYSAWLTYFKRRDGEDWKQVGFNQTLRRSGEPRSDLVKFFALSAKYPCVEYLTKMGMSEVVAAKVDGQTTYNAINWRGTTMEKVLRLSKQEIKAMRASTVEITPLVLYSYKFHKHHKDGGIQLTFEQAYQLRDLTFDSSLKLHESLGLPFNIAIRYVIKQLGRPKADKRYSNAASVLTTWRDYLADCKKLGMDVSTEAVKFPNDLHAAHQKTIEKVKYKEDKSLNILIAKRQNELIEKYTFEHKGLVIRPAADSIELFKEGKALRHCVGGYAKRYADGLCDLLVIRRSADPDEPFYTMEIRTKAIGHGMIGEISQCRGLKNCAPTPDVKAFIDLFTTKKLLTKKRTRVLVNMNQEAAV